MWTYLQVFFCSVFDNDKNKQWISNRTTVCVYVHVCERGVCLGLIVSAQTWSIPTNHTWALKWEKPSEEAGKDRALPLENLALHSCSKQFDTFAQWILMLRRRNAAAAQLIYTTVWVSWSVRHRRAHLLPCGTIQVRTNNGLTAEVCTEHKHEIFFSEKVEPAHFSQLKSRLKKTNKNIHS